MVYAGTARLVDGFTAERSRTARSIEKATEK